MKILMFGRGVISVFYGWALEKAGRTVELPMSGGGFSSDGVFRGALFGKVYFGAFLTDPNPRELAVRESFTKAGFTIDAQRDFHSWLSVHFALDCAIETEALKAGSTAQSIASGRHRRDFILNMRELVPLLAARSVDLKAQSGNLAPFRLPIWLVAPMMGLAPKLVRSYRVLIDGHSNMEELRSMCRDVLTEARRIECRPAPARGRVVAILG